MRSGKSTLLIIAILIILLLSLGQYRLSERLLFASEYHTNFVLLNVEGVVSGQPAGRVFQNRLLGPYLVMGLAQLLDRSLLFALKLYTLIMTVLANLLLGTLIYLRLREHADEHAEKRAVVLAVTAVALFVLLRLLYLYLLEYPWDLIDALIFMLFGYWAARRQPRWLLPLLFLVSLFNRETCLFLLLWFVLEALFGRKTGLVVDSTSGRVDWRQLLTAVFLLLATLLFIYGMREWLFIAPTAVAGVDLDAAQLGNNWNLTHNVNQFLRINWQSSLLFVNASLITAVLLLVLAFKRFPVAALWTACWLASIFAVGFINETRLYTPLFAFWLVYLPLTLWPPSREISRPQHGGP